ncbi:MAG: DUF4194 domain-containing protein [Spirochaetia bacterium]
MKLEKLEKLNEMELELFRTSLNALFTNTFIQRSIEKEVKLYKFVISNYELFEDYLSFAGWYLRKDENLGVITWYGPPNAKLSFNLDESFGLLVFRLIYEEKQMDLTLHGEKTIKQVDFQNKFKVLTDKILNKTRLLQVLRRFKALQLIKIIGDDTNPESVIILYPSIPFAVDGESIDSITDRINTLASKESNDNDDTEDAV